MILVSGGGGCESRRNDENGRPSRRHGGGHRWRSRASIAAEQEHPPLLQQMNTATTVEMGQRRRRRTTTTMNVVAEEESGWPRSNSLTTNTTTIYNCSSWTIGRSVVGSCCGCGLAGCGRIRRSLFLFCCCPGGGLAGCGGHHHGTMDERWWYLVRTRTYPKRLAGRSHTASEKQVFDFRLLFIHTCKQPAAHFLSRLLSSSLAWDSNLWFLRNKGLAFTTSLLLNTKVGGFSVRSSQISNPFKICGGNSATTKLSNSL